MLYTDRLFDYSFFITLFLQFTTCVNNSFISICSIIFSFILYGVACKMENVNIEL